MRAILGAVTGFCLMAGAALAAEPIATTDGEAGGLSLNVTQLKVSNGTVMLKFTIVNDGSRPFDPDTMSDRTIEKYDAHSIGGVYLIDTANKKKYLVIYDTDHKCICSRESANVEAKTSVNMWAKFPAPPGSITKIGIVVPHFQPLDDVPLSR